MLTERAGFEPADGRKPITGFQDRLLQPLGHLSSVKHRLSFVTNSGRRTRFSLVLRTPAGRLVESYTEP